MEVSSLELGLGSLTGEALQTDSGEGESIPEVSLFLAMSARTGRRADRPRK